MNRTSTAFRVRRSWRLTPRGFTLVEILITICILAILIALLLPAAHGAVAAARSFKCQTSQRSVAFDFGLFADDTLHPWRGDDDSSDPALRVVPRNEFRLETFIESQYGLDEFWDSNYGSALTTNLPDANGRDPMRCAEVKGSVTLRRAVPCTQGAVTPPRNISFGFNYRLQLSERHWLEGDTRPIGLSSQVLNSGVVPPSSIPLLWDVDGEVAAERSVVPLFTAPAMNSTTLYVNNQFWFPAMRHNGSMVVAFVDGHVATTGKPLLERGWAWDFDPAR
jgi:prepilin-type N-terminal cleavage/methylation domain-containing protein/prepilin-type processing-associated H-X9-DG protein